MKKSLRDHNIIILAWSCECLELIAIENDGQFIKSKIQETWRNNVKNLKDVLKTLWITMNTKYFTSVAESMSKRLQMVIKC